MSSYTCLNYSNNRIVNYNISYPINQQVFNSGMKYHFEKISQLTDNSGLNNTSKLNDTYDRINSRFEPKIEPIPNNHQELSETDKNTNNSSNNLLDLLDYTSFIKIIDLNGIEKIINLSKIKYAKLIDKDGNVIFKELHKKDFKKSLLKISKTLDFLNENIVFINFIDFNNNVISFRLNQLQLIKLYNKEIKTIASKLF